MIHSLAFPFFAPIVIIAHALSPYKNFMPTIVLGKNVLAIALVRTYCVLLEPLTVACFNPDLLEYVGAMRPQQRMMVETTRAFVKLQTKQSCGVSRRHTNLKRNVDHVND